MLKRQIAFWLVGFLVINLGCHLSAGTNSDSRFASLLAIVEDHSFSIDRYVDLTVDWARTPNGRYFSNKAPGPVLVAAPLFWILDQAVSKAIPEKQSRVEWLIKHKASWLKLFSYLFQIIPFICVIYLFSQELIKSGCSQQAIALFLAATLFGNTASLLMSTYYGHGMSALWILSMLLCLRRHFYFGVGFCFGFSVLTDYSGILLVFPLLFVIKRDLKNIIKIVFGGLLPLVLFVIYHQRCFGSPFSIANQFQNPIFKDVGSQSHNLWGILLPYPNTSVLYQLFLGQSRGMIWVVPWILLLLVWFLWFGSQARNEKISPEFRFGLMGLGLLVWMNSCFGGWHGGLTPGPRYLSPIFPIFGIALGLCFDQRSVFFQRLVVISVATSVFFSALVYANHISPDRVPLWPFYLESSFISPSLTTITRLLLVLPVLLFLWFRTVLWPRGIDE